MLEKVRRIREVSSPASEVQSPPSGWAPIYVVIAAKPEARWSRPEVVNRQDGNLKA
jgi:hypothetical protein